MVYACEIEESMKIFFKILRAPVFHFLIIGALLFGAQKGIAVYHDRYSLSPQEELVISAAQIEQIKQEITAQTGVNPLPEQVQAGIEMAINDEIFYRQALALKIDKNNPAIRRRLVQLAKFLSNENSSSSEKDLYRKALEMGLDRSDPVVRRQLIAEVKLIASKIPSSQEPAKITNDELQAYQANYSEKFMKPERLTFTHIYFSNSRRGKKAANEAKKMLESLKLKQVAPTSQLSLGDPFLSGNHFSSLTPAGLQQFFGPAFQREIILLDIGKWSGPIPSIYGWHVVWIEELKKAELSPLMEVANQIKGEILREREKLRLENTLQNFRSRYRVRVESPESPNV